MGLRVASSSLHWSQPSVPHSPPSSSQTLASAICSPSSKRSNFMGGDGGALLFCRYPKLYSSQSCGNRSSRVRVIRRALTASLDSFSDEEFSKRIQELALRFQLTDDENDNDDDVVSDNTEPKFLENRKPFDTLEPPNFPERDELIPANIEMKANSVDIPLSLRMIKRKKQWQEGFVEAGESAYSSVKKAFSSMVFIIRELHCYTLQMREILFVEDLQGILESVQREMHASFVWLFEKVFSHTPTLMMYLMLLLANYSVYSMSNYAAIASTSPAQKYGVVSVLEDHNPSSEQKFDSSVVKTLKLSSSNGNTASVGGDNGGGGGNYRPIASGTDGDGMFGESNHHRTITHDGVSNNISRNSGDVSVSRQEELLWDSIVEEASRMQDALRDEALDQDTVQNFVSPVDAKIETDDQSEYLKTEMNYQTELAQEPNNPLLLANYAQFLYLVAQDFDRAEEYFKRATKVEPKDGEAFNKYANFLWMARNDLWAAEETYLEAISAEPNNAYYAANYAHFLWNTGGEDTCFPLNSPDASADV